MNTKIYYLYRDASNYKVHNEAVIPGEITQEQIDRIAASLDDGEYFIPRLVGLPEKKFETYSPDDDHLFFELDTEYAFEPTSDPETVDIEPEDLVRSFEDHKDRWQQIAADIAEHGGR